VEPEVEEEHQCVEDVEVAVVVHQEAEAGLHLEAVEGAALGAVALLLEGEAVQEEDVVDSVVEGVRLRYYFFGEHRRFRLPVYIIVAVELDKKNGIRTTLKLP